MWVIISLPISRPLPPLGMKEIGGNVVNCGGRGFFGVALLSIIGAVNLMNVSCASENGVELAPFMGGLQVYTHKLALAAEAGNRELTEFYMEESMHLVEEIRHEVPVYDGYPIAELLKSIALPSYEVLAKALESKVVTPESLMKPVKAIVESCNSCHQASGHSFIRITPGFGKNPFNQDFSVIQP